MKTLILALPLLTILGGTSSLEERKLDHPWGRWRTGAWVETESTSSAFEGSVLVERNQLTGHAAESYSLRSTLFSDSGDVGRTHEVSWGMGGHAYALPAGKLLGEETLTIDGRSLECEVWEARWSDDGRQFVERTWTCGELAFPVRSVTRGPSIQLDVSVAKVRDYIEVGGHKLACVRLEGAGQVSGNRVGVTLWMSEHVPGGLARRETKITSPQGSKLLVKQVTEFHGEQARAR